MHEFQLTLDNKLRGLEEVSLAVMYLCGLS